MRILYEFNRLAITNPLRVPLFLSDTKPSHTSAKSANLLFETSSVNCKFFYHKREKKDIDLPTAPGILHCRTASVAIPTVNKIGYAFLFVPLKPIARKTPVKPNVKIAIGLH